MSDKIKPMLLGGFLDFLPEEMIVRQEILNTIKNIYERFGFDPIDTPCIEKIEVLIGNKEDFDMTIYKTIIIKGRDNFEFFCSKCGTEYSVDFIICPICGYSRKEKQNTALRFDLTVPLARVIASYPNLPKPFKRYQLGKVWRGEKPQAGRYREFLQFDADIVGSSSMLADTEIINIIYEVMKSLGFNKFLIRLNNRKILNGLAEYADFKDYIKEVLRIIDKQEKIGWEAIKNALKTGIIFDVNQKTEINLGFKLRDDCIDKIIEFLNISGDYQEIFNKLKVIFKDIPIGLEGVYELQEIINNLKVLEIPENNWCIDLSIARGLDYYTGPVYETVLLELPEIGSVFSGGRFDGLISRFSNASVPATGASIGVDRIFTAMKQLGMIKLIKTVTEVLIINFDPNLQTEYLKLAKEMRNNNIKTEIYFGEEMAFQAQLVFAVKQQIPVVIIMGLNEFFEGRIQVKDMRNREQFNLSRNDYLNKVKEILAK